MADEPTELDKLRMVYADQIVEAFRHGITEHARDAVDHLLSEWGAKAYYQGRAHMAERIKKCADDWKIATS